MVYAQSVERAESHILNILVRVHLNVAASNALVSIQEK